MKASEYRVEKELHEKHWWFVVRRKLLLNSFNYLRMKNSNPINRVYDIGCGVVGNANCIKPYINELIGIEPSEEACSMLIENDDNYDKVINIALEDIPNRNDLEKADIVIAMDVLEHLKDDETAIRIINNLLLTNGYLIVTVPAFMFLWGFQDEVGEHHRRYTLKQLVKKLKKENFSVIKKSYFNTFLFPIVWCWRWAAKIIKPKKLQSESQLNSKYINRICEFIFSQEIRLINRGCYLPYGVSAYIVAKKN